MLCPLTWLHKDVCSPGQKDGDYGGKFLALLGHPVHDDLEECQQDGCAGPALNQLYVRVQVGQDANGQHSGQGVVATQGSQSVTQAILCDEGADVDDMLCRESTEETSDLFSLSLYFPISLTHTHIYHLVPLGSARQAETHMLNKMVATGH